LGKTVPEITAFVADMPALTIRVFVEFTKPISSCLVHDSSSIAIADAINNAFFILIVLCLLRYPCFVHLQGDKHNLWARYTIQNFNCIIHT
jgi:hypothetical protein